jgi:streptogramin lyase
MLFPFRQSFSLFLGRCPSVNTAGPDGNLWFTLFADSAIGRITPIGSFASGFGIPTAKSGPEGITCSECESPCDSSRG